ncbi:MAG TPA: laccase domain-containing protein, partial [Bacillota bacterium]
VDEPVIRRVHDAFTDGDSLLHPSRPGHARLDLWEANRRVLVAAGVPPQRIATAGMCTCCDGARFFSYRRSRGGPTGQMAAILGFRALPADGAAV